jgi:D-amino-acid dehydrogenase
MARMNTRNADVLIVGGGVIGLACAYYLLCAGRSVTVLEQAQTGKGSSHGNCGTLTPSHASPLAMPGTIATALKWMFKPDAPLRIKPRIDPQLFRWLLGFAGRCNWRDFMRVTEIKAPFLTRSRELIADLVARENLQCEYQHLGHLYAYLDERAFEASRVMPETLRKIGMPVEILDGKQLIAMEPALRAGMVGGYFNPGDAQLRPDRYVAELARIVRERGGRIEEDTRVEGFSREAGRIDRVQTTRGEFTGREIIFALGAWTPAIARQLDLRVPIQPGKGYSITFTRPSICPRIPLVLRERAVCVTAWDSGYRLGSTMEFAGYDNSLNRTRLDALRIGAALYLREPEGPQVLEEWYGWRPMTPDDLPILGRVPGIDNLCMATGHGMLGVSMSAMTGVLISEYLTGREPSMDLAPFSISRFG